MPTVVENRIGKARRVSAAFERVESILRAELEVARAEFANGRVPSSESTARYQTALQRFNDFVIRREVPQDLEFVESCCR